MYDPNDQIGAIADQLAAETLDDMGIAQDMGAPQGFARRPRPRGAAPRPRGRGPLAQAAAMFQQPAAGAPAGSDSLLSAMDRLETVLPRLEAAQAEADRRQAEQNLSDKIRNLLSSRVLQLTAGRAGQSTLPDIPNVAQYATRAAEIRASATWFTGVPFSGTIPATSTLAIPQNPQRWFMGTRLVTSDALAPSIEVSDIKVANASQLIASGNVPGAALIPGLFLEQNFSTTWCPPAQQLLLEVVNTTGVAVDFLAVYFGYASMTSPQANIG